MSTVIMNWINKYISEIPIYAIVCSIFLYFLLAALRLLNVEIASFILLALLASISLHILNMAKKVDYSLDKISKIFNDVTILKNGSPALITGLSNQEIFYGILKEKVNEASERVWLMHFDPWAPDAPEYSDCEKEKYFDFSKNFAIEHPHVDVKRIIGIPNQNKLDWVEQLVEDTREIRNLHLGYLYVGDIQNSFPRSVTSCQIIDKNKIFLLNPLLNHIPPGDFKKCIYIENREIVSIYEQYYERIWNEITEYNSPYGCLLKDGPGRALFDQNVKKIQDNFNKTE